jgi:hypothetical protein
MPIKMVHLHEVINTEYLINQIYFVYYEVTQFFC